MKLHTSVKYIYVYDVILLFFLQCTKKCEPVAVCGRSGAANDHLFAEEGAKPLLRGVLYVY